MRAYCYIYLIEFKTILFIFCSSFVYISKVEGTKAAWILSAIGISNVIGRLAFGLISDRFSGTNIFFGLIRISALFINNVCLLIAGLSVMAIPFCPSYWILMAISILFGFTICMYHLLLSIF